jgi:hypothetical protein
MKINKLSIPDRNGLSRPRGSKGSSLVELMVGCALVAMLAIAVISGISAGFAALKLSRENARATQIMLDKMEATRVLQWDIVRTNGVPANFTDYYFADATNATGGVVYTGQVQIASAPFSATYSPGLKMITVKLDWNAGTLARHREISTLIASNGVSKL